ncbi:hypothetical protein EAI89_21840 [Eubacterium sp. am_0171]|nr:hypothetical protein EAI89_21840 [Eubacterium sp. am_0171]
MGIVSYMEPGAGSGIRQPASIRCRIFEQIMLQNCKIVTVQASLNCYTSSPFKFAYGEWLDVCSHYVFVRSAQ